MRSLSRCVCLIALVLVAPAGLAQYGFGQNKITYKRFDWKVYRSPHFDIHYYDAVAPQLQQLVSLAESAYLDVSKALDHEVKDRIPLLLYATHADFEQTNVILEEIDQGVGAFAEPFSNRMVVPVDNPSDFQFSLIKHELTHIFEYDILFAGSLRRTLRARPPFWLMEGLASYVGDDEDTFAQMVIRDGVVNNLVPSVRQLTGGYLSYRYGHAVFDFMASEWGQEGVRTFLFEFRKSLLANDLDKAFKDAFGVDVDQFDRRFARFLRQKYLPVLTGKRAPEEYGKEIGLTKPGRYTFSPTLSPTGELVAALATPGLELDVVILSPKDGKVVRNLTRGFTNRYQEITTGAFSGQRDLSWSADGDRLAFFVRKENRRQLLIYDPVDGRRLETIDIKEIASCASPAFSPDGQWIAFSGNKAGRWDIFRYNLETKVTENLTDDDYYDTNPTWSPDGQKVLYNRRIGSFSKIFTVDVGAAARKAALTTGASSDIMPVFGRDAKTIYFSSDRGQYGVYNLHRLDVATGKIERMTDLTAGAFAPVEMAPADDNTPQLAYAGYQAGTYRLYQMKVAGAEIDKARAAGDTEPTTSALAPSRRAAAAAAAESRKDPKTAPPAATTASPEAAAQQEEEDLRPFEPPLALSLDEDKKSPYEVKWSLDAPDISVGVADDGTFLSNVSVNFNDLLGDQRIGVRSYSVADFTNIQVAYANLTKRLDWGATFQDFRDYYYTLEQGNVRQRRSARYSSVGGYASYPFNRYYRIEGELTYLQRRISRPRLAPFSNQVVGFDDAKDDMALAGVSLVGDTTRYREWGAFQGHKFRIGPTFTKFLAGDSSGDSISGATLDFRAYQHVTRRSLVAFRLSSLYQSGAGDATNLYAIGGINQLRGFEFRDFVGDNYWVANFEFRFPLFDAIIFGFGGGIGPVRGFFFADAGSAWLHDALHVDSSTLGDPEPVVKRGKATYDIRTGLLREYRTRDDDGRYVDLHASGGVGLWAPILGLPFTWSFAFQYDGKDFGPWHSDFYIVYEW